MTGRLYSSCASVVSAARSRSRRNSSRSESLMRPVIRPKQFSICSCTCGYAARAFSVGLMSKVRLSFGFVLRSMKPSSASFVTVFAMTLLSRLSRFVTSSCVSSPWSQTIRMTTACAAVRSYCSQPSLSQMCDFLYNIDIALNGSSTIPATALASLPAYYTSIWWQLPPFITLISKEF